MKRNHFKDKNARYQCTKRKKKCLISFLLQCIKSKLIPKGLKPELEPTIGNCDQEFLDLWYSNLQEFSVVLMEGFLKFYDKTIIGTASSKTSALTKSTNMSIWIVAAYQLFMSFLN